ncbi:hypothetical protein TB2_021862 [Malus domestica]
MGMSQTDQKMKGWLYLVHSNRIGLQYSRKRSQSLVLVTKSQKPKTISDQNLRKKLCNLHALAEKKKMRDIRDGNFQLYPLNCSPIPNNSQFIRIVSVPQAAASTRAFFASTKVTTKANVDYEKIVCDTCRAIGFVSDDVGLDADNCKVLVNIEQQSPDIAQGVHGHFTK